MCKARNGEETSAMASGGAGAHPRMLRSRVCFSCSFPLFNAKPPFLDAGVLRCIRMLCGFPLYTAGLSTGSASKSNVSRSGSIDSDLGSWKFVDPCVGVIKARPGGGRFTSPPYPSPLPAPPRPQPLSPHLRHRPGRARGVLQNFNERLWMRAGC